MSSSRAHLMYICIFLYSKEGSIPLCLARIQSQQKNALVMTAVLTEENEIRLESCTHDSDYG